MRKKLNPNLGLCRAKHPLGYANIDDFNCAYLITSPEKRRLFVLVSDGGGWDHVSISIIDSGETPTWREMCHIKNLFFAEDECVIQYHPPGLVYVNLASGCLHLWRPQGIDIPMPPLAYV